jgi:hypothetical protein
MTTPHLWPAQVTTPDRTVWTWDPGLSGYRHDLPGNGTLMKDPTDLLTSWGITPNGTSPMEVADQLRALTNPGGQAGNVFEWCLEHSRATGPTRGILLELAFADPATWPGYTHLTTRTHSGDVEATAERVMELIILGELSLDAVAVSRHHSDLAGPCPEVTVTFPAYQHWLRTR